MINVGSFITALKVSWLRRLIIYSNNDSFSHLSKLNFNKLYSLGDVQLFYPFRIKFVKIAAHAHMNDLSIINLVLS